MVSSKIVNNFKAVEKVKQFFQQKNIPVQDAPGRQFHLLIGDNKLVVVKSGKQLNLPWALVARLKKAGYQVYVFWVNEGEFVCWREVEQ